MILGSEKRTMARAWIERDLTTPVGVTNRSVKRERLGHGAKLDVLNSNIRGR